MIMIIRENYLGRVKVVLNIKVMVGTFFTVNSQILSLYLLHLPGCVDRFLYIVRTVCSFGKSPLGSCPTERRRTPIRGTRAPNNQFASLLSTKLDVFK